MDLKQIRNAVVRNRPVQVAIRLMARRRLLPKAVHRRIPPVGPHPITSPAGRPFIYVAEFSDMLARGLVWENLRVWESASLKAFSQFASHAHLTLDIGAYSGIYSLIACIDGEGEVIAFEPNPATAPFLRANIAANRLDDRITVSNKAIADKPGTATLSIPFDTTASRIAVDPDGPAIEVTTIDDVLRGRKVDLIKIDTEGFEPHALRGASDALATHRPTLILECLRDEPFEEIQTILKPYGYRDPVHLGARGPQPTSARINAPGFANYLWEAP